MDSLLEGIYGSTPEPLPFAPSLLIRAFLLRRDRGNLLVYSSSGLDSDGEAIEELGGISRHYLNHRHEAMFASDSVSVPLFVHERDSEAVAGSNEIRGTFSKRHRLDDDFEVVPTPGHTPGATAFLWDGPGHRFLFTGDTICLREGEWAASVLDSSDRRRYIESLEFIRELDFDVLVPWAATAGEPHHALTDRRDAQRRIDAILERVRNGGDH